MSTLKPNFMILLGAQLMSVVGDSFGQRCSRVNFKHSPRHMMIGLCLMTAVQMFLIFGILQLALPSSISGAIYINNIKVPCYKELDIEGKIENCTPTNCTEIPCKSQGPFSMFTSIVLHPFLLTNGLMNIIYYNGEVLLYKEPLGLLFLVIAALSSTFLINPFNKIFGEPINQPIPPLIYLFGITGSILSVIEFTPKKPEPGKQECGKCIYGSEMEDVSGSSSPSIKDKEHTSDDEEEEGGGQDINDQSSKSKGKSIGNNKVYHRINDSDDTSSIDSPSIDQDIGGGGVVVDEKDNLINDNNNNSDHISIDQLNEPKPNWKSTVKALASRSIKILIPMILLCIANALWMETSLFYNDQFRVNAFGYNSLDQILLPFYLFIFMTLVDFIKPIKQLFLSEEDAKESLIDAVKATWKESSLINLFMYRLLINARAIIYFYLAIEYDLTLVYLELTLIRVVLNWVGAVVLNLIVPKFIKATYEERRKTFHPINIGLKCLGTVGVVVSLIILNK